MKEKDVEEIKYNFRFVFQNGDEKHFCIVLDQKTLLLKSGGEIEYPEWTKQKNISCPIEKCLEIHPDFCPVAVNLNRAIKLFGDILSYEEVTVHLETENRNYTKTTSIQAGAGSVIGILMTTSGCPVLDKLRPMVKYHLPFASIEETEFRVYSMFMLAQFLRYKKGFSTDWDMIELKNLYENIQKINRNLASKIADIERKDTNINAVVILNTFADSVSFNLDDQDFTSLEPLFKEWLT